MNASDDAVLANWEEHRKQLRQSENQRAALTNYVLVIVAEPRGFVALQRFAASTIPVSVLAILLGLYGALTIAKYHERANYHLGQARALTQTLAAMDSLADEVGLDEARQSQYRRFRRLHRFRLHLAWTGLHVGVSAYGLVLLILGIVNA